MSASSGAKLAESTTLGYSSEVTPLKVSEPVSEGSSAPARDCRIRLLHL